MFGWIIDVWLETFPLRQGQSRNEFEAKKGAIIGYRKYYTQKAIEDIEKLAKEMNIISPLADSKKEYIEKATQIINNQDLRKEIGGLYYKLNNSYRKHTNFLEVIK